MSDTAASRSARHPLGKLSAELPKIKIPDVVKERLEAEASALGLGLVDFVRDLVTVRALGLEEVKRLYGDRFDAVAGPGSDGGGKGA